MLAWLPGGGAAGAEVIYVAAGTPVVERSAPSEDIVVFSGSDAHLVSDLTLPDRAEDSPAFPHAEELAGVWWDIGYKIVKGRGPLRIGGIGGMDQDDPFATAAEAAGNRPEDWAMIGSWTPEGEGELEGYFMGSLQMLIRRDDLADRRFDRLRLTWQQAG